MFCMSDNRLLFLTFTSERIFCIIHYPLFTTEFQLMCLGVGVICAHQKQWLPFAMIAQIVGTDTKLIHTA